METLESLTQKAESCRKEIASLKQQIDSSGEDSSVATTEGGGAKDDDSLESFMAQNDRKGKEDARKVREARGRLRAVGQAPGIFDGFVWSEASGLVAGDAA